MRTEAKLGVVLGAAVVIAASWYFFQRQTDVAVEIQSVPPGSELTAQTDAQAAPSIARTHAVSEGEPPVAPVPPMGTPETAEARPAPMAVARSVEPASVPPAAETKSVDPLATVDLRGDKPLRANRRVTLEPQPDSESHEPEVSRPRVAAARAHAPETPVSVSRELDLRTLIGATTGEPDKAPVPTTRPSARAAAAQRRPVASPKPAFTEYVIKPGDSLAILSEVYYGNQRHVGALLAANPHIKDQNKIFVGTKIRIPPKSAVVGRPAVSGVLEAAGRRDRVARSRAIPPVAAGMYRVKPGDTLYGLAARHYGSGTRWRALLELNRDRVDGNGRNLRAGQLIRLPAVLPDAARAKATPTPRARR